MNRPYSAAHPVNGMIMQGAGFISSNKKPTDAQMQASIGLQSVPVWNSFTDRARRETRLLRHLTMNAMSLPQA